ncbi:MAG TPA: hypothetical protein VJB08_00815 [Candidatus Nanoarchaeia archaeon]|nr:hypothetical protein [Candidatus Nanoarchaeia archaeon]
MKKIARRQVNLENKVRKDFPRYTGRNAQRHYQRLSLLVAFLFVALVIGSLIGNNGRDRAGLAANDARQSFESDILTEGSSKTYYLNGVQYDVTLYLVATANQVAKFIVNGEYTTSLAEGESYTLADGAIISVKNILIGAVSFVEFIPSGSNRVEFHLIPARVGGAEPPSPPSPQPTPESSLTRREVLDMLNGCEAYPVLLRDVGLDVDIASVDTNSDALISGDELCNNYYRLFPWVSRAGVCILSLAYQRLSDETSTPLGLRSCSEGLPHYAGEYVMTPVCCRAE